MGSTPRRNPIDRFQSIRNARRTRRQRVRELMNRPTTFYIDRDCIPENIIEALENRLQPPVRFTFAPLENDNDPDNEDNLSEISDNEQSISFDSESSNSYAIDNSNNLTEDSHESSLSLSDFEEWEARAEIIQSEESYNSRDDSTREEISIEFSLSPSPLFVLPSDEEIDDDQSEELISRLVQGISYDDLLNILDNIDWSLLEEDDL